MKLISPRLAWIIIVMIAAISCVAAYQVSKIEFDYEFEHFFPTDDPELELYKEFRKSFETDIDFILIGIKNERGIFDAAFLHDVARMKSELAEVEHVYRIISPLEATDYALGPFGPIAIPYIHLDEPDRYKADSTRIYANQKQVGNLFSLDGKSISIVILTDDTLSKLETDTLYESVLAVLADYDFDEVHTAGKATGQAFYVSKVKEEFVVFFFIALVLVVVVLFLVYRSVWGVLVPLTVVLLSVVWLLGLMSFLGKPVHIMTTLLPLVLFVIGVSDVIHLLSRYFDEIRAGHEKHEAIRIAYKSVGMATLLTSITTSVGFLSLLTSGIEPIRELAVFASIGVFIAFALAFSLLPAILSITEVPRLAYREPSTVFWNRLVRWVFVRALRHRALVMGVSVVFVGVNLWLARSLQSDNHLLEDVAKDDPVRTSFEFFEANFSGVRPFELQYAVTDTTKNIFSPEVVAEMVLVEQHLVSEYGVGGLHSPLNILRAANQALHGGLDSAHALPTTPEALNKTTRLVSLLAKRPEFHALLTPDLKNARFSGRIHDIGAVAVREKDAHLAVTTANLSYGTVKLTGMAMLIDRSNADLSGDVMTGILIGVGAVALIVAVLFRSVRMVIVSLVPNVIPLVAIAGIMGLLGIDLKFSTSVVFDISFGIAVDDTIHYLMDLRQQRGKGRSLLYAMKHTSLSTGKAIILTSLIIIMGFCSLSFSSFTSTYYVGFLISTSLLVAVLADLFLLVAMLSYMGKR